MMESASVIKARLGSVLGSNGLPYWRSLSDFIVGKTSRSEFERAVRRWINTPELVELHNALLMSMITVSHGDPAFDLNTSGSNHPARKRRRLLPHQDPPPRLRRWALGMRKAERERVRGLAASNSSPQPLVRDDEITLDRPVMLRPEGKNPPGTRVPVTFSSTTRTLPSHQNLTERISLIASQHNLTTSRPVATLATAAVEAYLKQLSMHALTLTSSSHPFTSINPTSPTSTPQSQSTLTMSSLVSLLTVIPSSLPTPSAASDKLFLRGSEPNPLDEHRRDAERAMDAGLDEGLAQYWALLSARSGVRDFLDGKGDLRPDSTQRY